MRDRVDRRVLPEPVLALVRASQRRVPCHVAGGAALSGAYFAHRLSGDVDLFCHAPADVRALVQQLPAVATEAGLQIDLVRDGGTFVRAKVTGAAELELDIVHDSLPDLEPPPPPVDGIVVDSLTDLRVAKLTCLLSRSEPRDLVDLFVLDRAGYPPERDLPLALRKDAGLDAGVLAWLLGQFPLEPLPLMLVPLDAATLRAFRDDLRERFRALAVP